MESNFTNEEIIQHFHKHLEKKLTEKEKKKNPQYINTLLNIKPEDLILNDESAKLVIGHTKSNGTAVGKHGDYERTINLDVTSQSAVFLVEGSSRAAQSAVDAFEDGDNEFYRLNERGIEHCAYAWNRSFCKRNLKDLNYEIDRFRLNRYSFHRDSDEFNFSSIIISAKIKDQKGLDREITLGRIFPSKLLNNDGVQSLKFDSIAIPKTKKAKIKKALLICGSIALVIGVFVFLLLTS